MPTYWLDAKPKAAIERDNLLGMMRDKQGKTLTEPSEFYDMVKDIRQKANWSDQGLKEISFNQAVFFCVKVVHAELIDQLNGKIPID